MPYSRSRAREEFETGSKSLRQLAKKVSYKSSPLSYEHKLLIYQSAIFLMSAKVEEYTKTIIEDLIFKYRSKNAPMADIPDNLKTKTLIDYQLSHYKNFTHNSDERKLLEKVNCRNNYYDILNPASSFSSVINSQNVLSSNKYPSVKNFKILYYRIGIKDIFQELAKKGKKNYQSQLESFLSIREAIAHQEAPALTNQDVERHIKNLDDFVNKTDRVVYSHIRKTSGEKYWN